MSSLMDEAWVQGFVTSYNLYGIGSDDVARATDVSGRNGWIDNYCRDHPLDTIAAAAIKLVEELGSHPR